MAKAEAIFMCNNCGNEFPRWMGRCTACDSWDSIKEMTKSKSSREAGSRNNIYNIEAGQNPNKIPITKSQARSTVVAIGEIKAEDDKRISSNILELDRVLGGGVVKGSAVLISGEPGIGKSTLMLQTANALAKSGEVLYVSGEESASQVGLRARRLNTLEKGLKFISETDLFGIEQIIAEHKPAFVIIDSIQTISKSDVNSAAGSVSQIKESAAYLVQLAKALNIAIFMVGHVTKEGNIAGPRILEHVVDTVLYFEGERHKQYRILRAHKNRFGSTDEIGIFEMKTEGLVEVLNPSQIFLNEKEEGAYGSVVTCALEGTRPLMVEVQALVNFTPAPIPRRTSTGVDYNRVNMIIAILERHLDLKLYNRDVYVNIAGGVKVNEPAIDLAVAAAIISSYHKKPINAKTVIFGEMGLTGEIRMVNQVSKRVGESLKLGFSQVVLPQGNASEVSAHKDKLTFVKDLRAFTGYLS